MFHSQFTDEGYVKFINETAMYYVTTTQDAEFITKVKDVYVTQNKEDELRYTFTATINYTDNNNESGTTKISGNAEFKEKGKLTIFKITTNDLLEKMKKIANEVKIPKEQGCCVYTDTQKKRNKDKQIKFDYVVTQKSQTFYRVDFFYSVFLCSETHYKEELNQFITDYLEVTFSYGSNETVCLW